MTGWSEFNKETEGDTGMKVEIIEPKYFMINCKYIVPGLSYESYLLDIINSSRFFRSKCSIMESYISIEDQSHGEDDAYTSTYQMDFKLLVDEEVMRELNKNMPEVDYSQMSKGLIFTKTKANPSVIPNINILEDIMKCKHEETDKGKYPSKTVKNLVKNLHKKKNLFLYYPYEYTCEALINIVPFENMLTKVFSSILAYRDNMDLGKDTFVCIKVNEEFLIFEWEDSRICFRDNVNEMLCSNYRNIKLYSLY